MSSAKNSILSLKNKLFSFFKIKDKSKNESNKIIYDYSSKEQEQPQEQEVVMEAKTEPEPETEAKTEPGSEASHHDNNKTSLDEEFNMIPISVTLNYVIDIIDHPAQERQTAKPSSPFHQYYCILQSTR